MRIKPDPGVYIITVDGREYSIAIDANGIQASTWIPGHVLTWRWEEIDGLWFAFPTLVPITLSFGPIDPATGEGTVYIHGSGRSTEGTYRHA